MRQIMANSIGVSTARHLGWHPLVSCQFAVVYGCLKTHEDEQAYQLRNAATAITRTKPTIRRGALPALLWAPRPRPVPCMPAAGCSVR